MKNKFKLILITLFVAHMSFGQWVKMSDCPGFAGPFPSGFGIGNKAYVLEGQCTNGFWEYDITNDTWAQKATFPGSCRFAGVAVSINGKGYFGTGQKDDLSYENDWWEYDPIADVWTQKASLPADGRWCAVGFSIGNKGYLGTGGRQNSVFTFYNDFWEYDPVADLWTQKANVPGPERENAVAISFNGKGYAGLGSTPGQSTDLSDFYEYSPSENAWTQKQSKLDGGRSSAGIFVLNNEIYVAGGTILSSILPFYTSVKYNPLTNVWSYAGNFIGGAIFKPVAVSFTNAVYMGLGLDDALNNRKDWWRYTLRATSIDEGINRAGGMLIYPSPCKESLCIKLPDTNSPIGFKLLAVDGRVLMDKQLSDTETKLDLSEVSHGVYFVELIYSGGTIRKKIIKE